MREFDYIIVGGGCAGLSLAYELEINKKLENKTLAIIEQREEYKLYDQEHKERISIAKEFRKRFSRFDVFIGGDISVDICLRGAHKGQVFHLLATFLDGTESLSFFGDKMGKWGIDEPLAELMSSQPKCYSFEINEGYAETKHILRNIYEYVEHMDMLESQET